MPKPHRLLLSARDPAAAAAMAAIVRKAMADPRFEPVLAAAPPACDILAPSFAVERCDASQTDGILAQAGRLLDRIRPDAVIAGLSGPEPGLDEALIKLAAVPTFAVQDFWGDVNAGFGCHADTYFVQDRYAAELTRTRAPEARTTIVGSVKHSNWTKYDVAELRRAARAAMGVQEGKPVIAFFGQPFGQAPGRHQTLEAIGRVLAEQAPGTHLFFKPHPKETAREREENQSCLGAAGAAVHPMPAHMDPLSAVAVADLQISILSTVSLDLCVLGQISPVPLGIPIHAPLDPQLRDWLYRQFLVNRMPPSRDGLILHCETAGRLARTVARFMAGPGLAAAHWRRLRTHMPPPEDAVRMILDHVASCLSCHPKN